METSDSECFESADEDLLSDDENTQTVKNVATKQESDVNDKLERLNLKETESVTNSPPENNNDSRDSPRTENIPKDDENNLSTCQVEKKATVKKLGSKLGQDNKNIDNKSRKIEETITNHPDKKKPETDENLWEDDEIDWGQEKEDNMWDNDDWEPVDSKPQEKTPPTIPWEQEASSPASNTWGSWGNWGSLLSTATQSVSTLTQGISTALETGIGFPDPEELARMNAEKEKLQECPEDDKNIFGLGNLVMGVSHLTKLVESTGTKVISGGLDTLETIGKKTMEVLQDGDPGLKKKRAFLKIDQDKPVLSQLLREAKEKAEHENRVLEEKHFATKAKNYETLFDDHQGLVHLEALEMLSRQCDIKLQTLLESYTDDALTDMQETMDQVKELCELPDEDEDEQSNSLEIKDKLESAVKEINIQISYKKLIETWDETETWLNSLKLEICDERELHQQAIETLAQLTAIAVEQFHKTGELLLVKEHRSTADEADSLVQLTTTLTSLIGVVAAKFSDKLNAKSANSKNKEEVNGLITNVFFEAANSSSYIQDAFQLLIPVLQVGAI